MASSAPSQISPASQQSGQPQPQSQPPIPQPQQQPNTNQPHTDGSPMTQQPPQAHQSSPPQPLQSQDSHNSIIDFSSGIRFPPQGSNSTLGGGVGLGNFPPQAPQQQQPHSQEASNNRSNNQHNFDQLSSQLQNHHSFSSASAASSNITTQGQPSKLQPHTTQQPQKQHYFPQQQGQQQPSPQSNNEALYESFLSQQLQPQQSQSEQRSQKPQDNHRLSSHRQSSNDNPNSELASILPILPNNNSRGNIGLPSGNFAPGSMPSNLPGNVLHTGGSTSLWSNSNGGSSSNQNSSGGGGSTVGVIARPTPPGQTSVEQSQRSPFSSSSGDLLPPANSSQHGQYTAVPNAPQTLFSNSNTSTSSLTNHAPPTSGSTHSQASSSAFALPQGNPNQMPSYFSQTSQQPSQPQRSQQSATSPQHHPSLSGSNASPHYSPLMQHTHNTQGSPRHSGQQVMGSPHGSLTGTVPPGSAGTRGSGRGSVYSPPPFPPMQLGAAGPPSNAGSVVGERNEVNPSGRDRERERDQYDHYQPPLHARPQQTQHQLSQNVARLPPASGLGRPVHVGIDTNIAQPQTAQNPPSSGQPSGFSNNSPVASGQGTRDPITLSSNNPALHRALLTPITNGPAPPPAPSAPPTASTPGTDYYYWGVGGATARWRDRDEDDDYGPGPAPSTMTSLRGMPGSTAQGPRGGLIGFLRVQGLADGAGDRRGTVHRGAGGTIGISGMANPIGLGMDAISGFTGMTSAERPRDEDGRRQNGTERDGDRERERIRGGPSMPIVGGNGPGERPSSTSENGDNDTDPIPTEYRPIKRVGIDNSARGNTRETGSSSSTATSTGAPGLLNQYHPPPRPQYQPHQSPPANNNPTFGPSAGKAQAKVVGPTGVPSLSNASLSTATRESIMRGQWVGGTAAVAGPAPIPPFMGSNAPSSVGSQGVHQRKASSEAVVQQQMQERGKPNPGTTGIGAGLQSREQPKRMFSTDTIGSQEWSHVSPVSSAGYQTAATNTTTGSFIKAEDLLSGSQSPDKFDATTNPSAVPSPEMFHHHHPLQHRPAHQQKQKQEAKIHRSQGQSRDFRRPVSTTEEHMISTLKNLYKVLPESHIFSLHNFALYLSEDAIASEKAKGLIAEKNNEVKNDHSSLWTSGGTDGNDADTKLASIADQRLERWNEWVKLEDIERKREIAELERKRYTKGKSVGGSGRVVESGRISGASDSSGVFVDSNISSGIRRNNVASSGSGEIISPPPASAVGKKVSLSFDSKSSNKSKGNTLKNPFDTETETGMDTDTDVSEDYEDSRPIPNHRKPTLEPGRGNKGTGMQPLPPPPRITKIDDGSTTPPASVEPFLKAAKRSPRPRDDMSPPLQTLHHHHPPPHHHTVTFDLEDTREGARTPPEAPEPPPQSPSPTPTFIQVAAAPKVDLELQMPRPMPSVPAMRLDPSVRKRLVDDDDASTIADSDRERPSSSTQIGHPGATPFYPNFGKKKEQNRPVDIKPLSAVIASFMKTAGQGGSDVGPEIPQFLQLAYQALDTATHSPSLETYLSDARRRLDQKTNQLLLNYTTEANARRQKHNAHANTFYSRGSITFPELDRMRENFEQEEAQRKMELDKEIYLAFENEYVEIAYKDVKGQLEVLGGRWYEEVKTWLLKTAAAVANPSAHPNTFTKTAMHYLLLLEAVDLLNKLHISMEEHEHVLQGLISDRNQRYLQVSISPLLLQNNTAHAFEAERRFWVDEQERLIAARIDQVKRATDHAGAVERIVGDFIRGLKHKFHEVVKEFYEVIFKLPSETLQSQFFRRFFDEMEGNKASTVHMGEVETLSIPTEVVAVFGDAIHTLRDICMLIKLALELQGQSQIRLCEAQCSLQAVQEHNKKSGITSPQVTSAAITSGLAQILPNALKRLSEEQNNATNNVMEENLDIVRRLGGLVSALERNSDPARPQPQPPMPVNYKAEQQQQQQQSQQQQQQVLPQRWNVDNLVLPESPLWSNSVPNKDWMFQNQQGVPIPPLPQQQLSQQQHPLQQSQQQPIPPPHQQQPSQPPHSQQHQQQQASQPLHPQQQGPPQPHVPSFSSLMGSLRAAQQSRGGNNGGLLNNQGGYSPGGLPAFNPIGTAQQGQSGAQGSIASTGWSLNYVSESGGGRF